MTLFFKPWHYNIKYDVNVKMKEYFYKNAVYYKCTFILCLVSTSGIFDRLRKYEINARRSKPVPVNTSNPSKY